MTTITLDTRRLFLFFFFFFFNKQYIYIYLQVRISGKTTKYLPNTLKMVYKENITPL